MVLADNQKHIAEELDKKGALINLGWHEDVTEMDIRNVVQNLLADSDKRRSMGLKGKMMVAGIGAIEYLGWSGQLGPEDYTRAVSGMLGNPQRVRQIGNAALRVLQPGATSLANVMQRLIIESESFCSSNHTVSSG